MTERATFDRKHGSVSVEIVSPDDSGAAWVEFVARNSDKTIRQRLGFRREELDRLVEVLSECRRLLLGHPKHQPKEKLL